MENNFDIKKYDKKVALGYKKIAGLNFNERKTEELSALLCADLYFYGALKKIPEHAEKAVAALCEKTADCRNSLNGENAAVYSEALFALTEYHAAFGGEAERLAASKIAEAFAENFCFETVDEKKPDKKANDENATASELFCSDCGENAFACMRGLVDYLCVSGDKKLSGLIKSGINTFFSRDIRGENFSLISAVRFLEGALAYAVYTDDGGLTGFVCSFAERCFIYGLGLNYSAKKSFAQTAGQSDTAATASLFSLFLKLYSVCGETKFRDYARRIWFNGLQFCQREDGGAGEDSLVTEESPELKAATYEDFTASCLYAEALCAYAANKKYFENFGDGITRDRFGRIFMGDKLFVRDQSGFFGKDLIEVPTMTAFDKETALQLRLKVCF